MKYLTYTLVALLVWAHVAPQVASWVNAKPVAESYGCERDFTFYLLSLDSDVKINCSQYSSYKEFINAQ